jgi:energy-coupling factor transporter ATP-binding protein EcfA2
VSELAIRRGAAPALSIEGLGYRYPHAAGEALAGVSLEIAPGEFTLLAGRSASGKSTLLKAACGLVPHFHGGEIEGTVGVAGVDAIESGPGELAAVVGYVAQDPETQVVSTTVAAEIELPLEMRGDAPSDRARAVEEAALALAIPHLLGRTVDTLSGGELQRVALAAALVTRPRLVLLDEPTSQLDPVAGDELIWLLRRLNEEWGVAVLLAEHRLERCLAAADRVVAMEAGAISFDGPPAEFLAWAEGGDPALSTPAARLFSLAGIEPLPVGVRAARRSLEAADAMPVAPATTVPHPGKAGRLLPWRDATGGAPGQADQGRRGQSLPVGKGKPEDAEMRRVPGGSSRRAWSWKQPSGGAKGRPPASAVLTARAVWVELERDDEPHDVLRGIDLKINRGERVALMGRNGAGKSTLLRAAAGLIEPVAGKIELDGTKCRDRDDKSARRPGIALLTQSPGDYLVRERVGDELPGEAGMAALRAVGLEQALEADPRDLSGGERQRLALAIALAGRIGGEALPGLVALDEPTRGMDRGRKNDLVGLVERLAEGGAGVVIATHDVEFAAAFAERVVLLGDGVVIADGPAAEILSGGWYFATEVARVLDLPGVVTPEQGAAALRGGARE